MTVQRSLISPTASPALHRALLKKLALRGGVPGQLGELEPLAVRLGLIQGTLKPRFRTPQIVFFLADHGLAVDGVARPLSASTAEIGLALLQARSPAAVFARNLGLELSVVDSGMAEVLSPHPRLLARKIAHGSRNTRSTSAMSLEQTHAAIRAGMEIADGLPGNAVACAGVGVGADESAALVLSALTGAPVMDLATASPDVPPAQLQHLQAVLQTAQTRHRDVHDPVEILAAFGGFEMAMMVGLMLVAASKRSLLVVDGLPACAALMVAARIAPAVTDYCLFSRSHRHEGLDQGLDLFGSSALIELGLESIDGTGATLSWPLIRSAAALLTEVAEGADPGPSQPVDFPPTNYLVPGELTADLPAAPGDAG
jgi:nicotinate-nucleotide--dimethylbenzimidazole phosphoribosyltransferase